MNFTEASVRNLSPDEASAKAGYQLATPAKWVNAHEHDAALWGECKGSGANPYFTQIDLNNIAFKCSCPSRKFPCKHGLGLLWLYVKHADYFQKETELHEKVADWLGKRQERTTNKVQKEEKPVDEIAQQKRLLLREQKVNQGLDELDLWMKDIIRTGIRNLPQQQYSIFQNITAHMIDAQAGGLANRLRDLSEINYFSTGWEAVFMKNFTEIYFIIHVYRNRENLSPEWQQELRSSIGWNTGKEELNSLPGIENKWLVVNVQKESVDKLISEKIWIYGIESGLTGYYMQFYMPQQSLSAQVFIPGQMLKAKVVFYPGIASKRVMIKDSQLLNDTFIPKTAPVKLQDIMLQITEQKVSNPLLNEISFLLTGVHLIYGNLGWYLRDTEGKCFRVKQEELILQKIWAMTGSAGMDVFVIYNQGSFRILSLFFKQSFYAF